MNHWATETACVEAVDAAIQLQSYERAQIYLASGLKSFPDSPVLWRQQGLLYLSQGHYAQAVSALEKAQNQLEQPDAELLEAQAIALMKQNQPQQAIVQLHTLAQLEPERVFPVLYLAEAYERLGALNPALEHYAQALQMATPENYAPLAAEVLPQMAQIYLQQQNRPKAKERLETLQSIQPYDPMVKLQLAFIGDHEPDQHTVLKLYTQILNTQDKYAKNPGFLCNFIQSLFYWGHHKQVYQTIRFVLNLEPDYAPVWLQLGQLLLTEQQLQPAYLCYSRVLLLAMPERALSDSTGPLFTWNTAPLPNYLKDLPQLFTEFDMPAEWGPTALKKAIQIWLTLETEREYANQAIYGILETLNLNQERRFIQELITLPIHDDATGFLILGLAKNYHAQSKTQQALDLMLNFFQQPIAKKGGLLATLFFETTKYYDKLGQPERAFHFAKRAHQMTHKTYYDPEEQAKYSAKLRQVFSRTQLQSAAKTNGTAAPIFIVGIPRSGSTLVEQILSAHSQVYASGEVAYLTQSLNASFERLGFHSIGSNNAELWTDYISQLQPSELEWAAEDYLARHQEDMVEESGHMITDKRLNNFMFLGWIQLVFPRAKIIHCRRHLWDSALSCYFTPFKNVLFCHELDHIGQYIQIYIEMMNHWSQVLDLDILHWDYEALIDNPEARIKDLLAFCELPAEPACFEFYRHRRVTRTASQAQVHRPIYKQSVQRHKPYETYLEPLRRWFDPETRAGSPSV